MKDRLILATRGSALALAQAELVLKGLKELGTAGELLTVSTRGDRDRKSRLADIGGKGLFVREIERELILGNADLAVHSGKDLPAETHEGLVIAGVLKTGDERDCLITKKGTVLKAGLAIGTGSARREAELKKLLPEARVVPIRGNVDTRLEKLRAGELDGVILAKAGLDRLSAELKDLDVRVLSPGEMLPSPCQGIIALQCRRDDLETRERLGRLSHEKTWKRFCAERYLLGLLGADCRDPVAIFAELNGERIRIRAMLSGVFAEREGKAEDYEALCREAAEELLKAGGNKTACPGVQKGAGTCPGAHEAAGTGPGAHDAAGSGPVALVGAGCGPGLITLKGLEAIRKAEVIVYDDLLDPELLLEAGEDCELIYAGKRMGRHSRPQEETEALLIEKAKSGKRVVRLKGGDSFIFGRGGEEILSLERAGIRPEVIPGVSSAYAVPGHAGIPVTHRSTAQSVTFITGHSATDRGENYKALAGLSGTLVFLMGLNRAGEIGRKLMEAGKSPDTPASIISRGYTAREKRIDGTLEKLSELSAGAESPAVIVVGETAALHLENSGGGRLSGVSLAAAGTETFVKRLCRELSGLGAETLGLSCLKVIPQPRAIPEDVSSYTMAVFTSVNGVEVFFDSLLKRGTDLRCLLGFRFACLGKETGESLRARGFIPDIMPDVYTAKELGAAIASSAGKAERVLILRAEQGSPFLTEELERAGISYEDIPVYRTEEVRPVRERVDTDFIVFGSARGVDSFFAFADHGENTVPVCIGPYTGAAYRKHKETEPLVAEVHTAEGIIQRVLQAIN